MEGQNAHLFNKNERKLACFVPFFLTPCANNRSNSQLVARGLRLKTPDTRLRAQGENVGFRIWGNAGKYLKKKIERKYLVVSI